MDQALKHWLLAQASYYMEYLQHRKSIALLEAVRRIDPKDIDVHRMLSYAYLEADRPEDAIKSADTFFQYAKPGSDTRAIKWIKGRALLSKKKSAAVK